MSDRDPILEALQDAMAGADVDDVCGADCCTHGIGFDEYCRACEDEDETEERVP